jgi:hypothetical protein
MKKVDPRIVSSVTALLAGMVANKLVGATWRAATGRAAPTDPEQPDVELREALLFAIISGALIALARLVAVRSTHKFLPGPLPKNPG